MAHTIFIGNLPSEAREEDVSDLLETYGELISINLIIKRQTGKSRGICFVEMDKETAEAAIKGLNNKEYGGKILHVRFVEDEDGKDTSTFQ